MPKLSVAPYDVDQSVNNLLFVYTFISFINEIPVYIIFGAGAVVNLKHLLLIRMTKVRGINLISFVRTT